MDNAPEIVKERLKPYQFQPGNPGGPGRPKGKSLRSESMKQLGRYINEDDPEYLKRWFKSFFTAADTDPQGWQARALGAMILGQDMFDRYDAWVEKGEKQDRLFLSYTLHKRATDIQRRILFSQAKYLFLMAGRRAGKTEALRYWFADELVQKPDARCLYIGLTITRAMGLLWQPMMDLLADLGIKVKEQSRVEGRIVTEAGGLIQFGGNATKDEREKNRGPWWDRIAIDEAQSQKELLYLIESILSPTLVDTKGQLAVCGTGPRVRGTYWEALFVGHWADGRQLYSDALRMNWNLSQNPYIPDFETVLETLRAEKNLKDTDPLYQREYLGRIAYDDDALVLRLSDDNAFDDDSLGRWIRGQPVVDIRFTAGLDFGFTDSDALSIICYSRSRPERWLVYEYKANRIGTAELAAEIRKGLEYVRTSPLFEKVPTKDLSIYADTGGNAITPYDLATQYNLPIATAYKAEKDMAVELLQDECRRRLVKVRKGGPFWEECLRTVYRRDEQDALTREVDDETYHPDMIPSVTYAMRDIWLFNQQEGK